MRLGYNTNGFSSHRLEDALRVITGLGYRSVAITLDAGALDPFDGGTLEEAKRIGAWLEGLDVLPVVETGARFLLDPWRKHWPTLLSPRSEDRDRRIDFLERSIEVADALGSPVLSLWSGTAETREPTETLDQRLADGLGHLVETARRRGVQLAFEPEPGMHVESMSDYERVRDAVPGLRLTLDVGHAHITEEDGAVATVRRFAPEIANVHLEGMFRDRHDHLLPGEGDLDLAAVVAALRKLGYQGPANLELSRHSHMAVEAARHAKAFFD